MDFFKSEDNEVERSYLDGLKGCDSKTRELLINNHKACNEMARNAEDTIETCTMLTTAQLPVRLQERGIGFKGPCMIKCDIAKALQNQIGQVPPGCVVTNIKLLNCSYQNSDPKRKLYVSLAGGAAAGMYADCKAVNGAEDDVAHDIEIDASHLMTLSSGTVLNDVGTIYDQSDFLKNPVYKRYRAVLAHSPHKDRSDTNAKVQAARYSTYLSPYMRNISAGDKNVTTENGVVRMQMEDGEEIFSHGDVFIDLMSKNFAALPGFAEGNHPIASWTEAGPGKPEVLQVKTSIEDADRVMETVNDAIMAPLKERTINLADGEGLVFKMQTSRGALSKASGGGGEDKKGASSSRFTDWSESTNASMTMQITVAYDKNELENKETA